MTNEIPKPSPRPHASLTATPPADTRAGFHVREARRILTAEVPEASSDGDEQLLYLAAISHALTSLAFTQLNPPPRRRPRQCASQGGPTTGPKVVTR